MKIKLIRIPKLDFNLRQNSIMVKMAEYRVAYNPTNLSTWTLGSCVAIILFDPYRRIGGLAHCMLPEPHGAVDSTGRYVTTAIPEMIKNLKKFGVQEKMLRAAIVGGASVLKLSSISTRDNLGSIGLRNARKAKSVLHSLGIPLDVDETGGNKGRNLLFKPVTGEVLVAYITKPNWL